jgi:hypothetical protein
MEQQSAVSVINSDEGPADVNIRRSHYVLASSFTTYVLPNVAITCDPRVAHPPFITGEFSIYTGNPAFRYYRENYRVSDHAPINDNPVQYFFELMCVVRDSKYNAFFICPRIETHRQGLMHPTYLVLGAPFISPMFPVPEGKMDDAVAAVIDWFYSKYSISRYHRLDLIGEDGFVLGQAFELLPANLGRDAVLLDSVVDFGGRPFSLRSEYVSQTDIAKLQLRAMINRPEIEVDVSPIQWIIAAMRRCNDASMLQASRLTKSTFESIHYYDPLFRGGHLSESDMEEGMLIYTHRWDGAPIAVLKTDYAADYISARERVSIGKGRFICNFFRTCVTVKDGFTHAFIRPIVVDGKKWWVWSTRSRGWFACDPAEGDVYEALGSGVYKAKPRIPLEFVSMIQMERSGGDIEAEITEDMGSTIELDTLHSQIVFRKPAMGTGYAKTPMYPEEHFPSPVVNVDDRVAGDFLALEDSAQVLAAHGVVGSGRRGH